jgi:uncharacterized OB-fold protein
MPSPSLACPHLLDVSGDRPRLLGSRCAKCGESYFPGARSCTRCLSTDMQACDLGSAGTLWSWTIQGFLPKPPYNSGETPESFKPYGVGYVEMACGLKVESRLAVADSAALHIGMPMVLTLVPYRLDDTGQAVSTFAFEPADPAERGHHHG